MRRRMPEGTVSLFEVDMLVVAYFVMINLITIACYMHDKTLSASGLGLRRIPESTLHLLGLLGGWPGGVIARRVFRHKTRKQPFVMVFWIAAAANIASIAATAFVYSVIAG